MAFPFDRAEKRRRTASTRWPGRRFMRYGQLFLLPQDGAQNPCLGAPKVGSLRSQCKEEEQLLKTSALSELAGGRGPGLRPGWTHLFPVPLQGVKPMDLLTALPYPGSFTPTGIRRMRRGKLVLWTLMLILGHVVHSLAFDDAGFCAAMQEIAKERVGHSRVAVAVVCDAKMIQFKTRPEVPISELPSGWQERAHALMNQTYCDRQWMDNCIHDHERAGELLHDGRVSVAYQGPRQKSHPLLIPNPTMLFVSVEPNQDTGRSFKSKGSTLSARRGRTHANLERGIGFLRASRGDTLSGRSLSQT